MKDMDKVNEWERKKEQKWDDINAKKRREISLGQAINLAEAIAGRSYDKEKHTVEEHIDRTFAIVPLVFKKIMAEYEKIKE